jgi:pSer/pThr/pTyr-binding forkhead associated (FHA) protein
VKQEEKERKKMATLALMYKEKQLQAYPLGMGDTLIIGRQNTNDIVIDNLAVSSLHSKVESIGEDFLLIDLQSENGSFVNDKRIKSHWLNDGDVITVGKHTLLFSNPKTRNSPGKMSSSIIETMQMDTEKFRQLLKQNEIDLPPAEDRPRKTISGSLAFLSERRQNLPLNELPVRIGKAASSDIVVKGLFIGKTAAVINKIGDGWHLSYVGGLAKVKINGNTVKTAVKLSRLDIITIGGSKIQFIEQLTHP